MKTKIQRTTFSLSKGILLLLFVPIFAGAQKKKFTMQEAVTGLGTNLRISNLSQLQFCGSSDSYSYTREKDSTSVLYQADPSDHKATPFMDLNDLNALLSSNGEKEVKAFPSITWVDENSFYFNKSDKTYWLSKNGERMKLESLWTLPKGATITAKNENKPQLAFINKHNLNIVTPQETIPITTDGTENIVYGQAVHRYEFGIMNGSFWSPNSNFLAFYRMDQGMVNDYPIIDWASTPAKAKTIKYPMAGGTSHQVTIGIYDIKNKATQYLDIEGPRDQYLTSVSWGADEQSIYVGVLSRDQKHLDFNKYNVATGKKMSTIFTDKNDRYVEPQHPLWFYNETPGEYIWLSQRDGYMHMYLYKNDAFAKQVTQGAWIVNEILGYNKEKNEIIFTGTKDHPMQKNIYAVNLSSEKIRKINSEAGWHSPQLSKSGTQLIDDYSNSGVPRNIEVLSINNPERQKRLLTAKNTLADYETATVKRIKLRLESDLVLYSKLIYPANFDSTKKYPAIVYVYNGPHVQLVKNSFPYSGNLWRDYMASKGYFVYVLDGRGSSNRGFEFESAMHRKMGEVEMEDQLKGVEYLTSLPYIDADRLGVHGWSYGGYMTTSLMTKHPGVFKCGVAGGPVMDWEMYEIMYTERYMDTPDSTDNKEGYDRTRLWDKSADLEGNLLIIHGAQDDVVLWQHSMKFIRDAVKNNKPVDYFVYPSHPHNVRGKDRIHLMQKITDYFDLYLK